MKTIAVLPDDPRDEMVYDQVYELHNPGGVLLCTVSNCPESGQYVTKEWNTRQPKGHLYSRCQVHQDRRDLREPSH